MTCNLQWPEMKNAFLHWQSHIDRPDLGARVFSIELRELMAFANNEQGFGEGKAQNPGCASLGLKNENWNMQTAFLLWPQHPRPISIIRHSLIKLYQRKFLACITYFCVRSLSITTSVASAAFSTLLHFVWSTIFAVNTSQKSSPTKQVIVEHN